MKVKRFIGGSFESNGYVLYHDIQEVETDTQSNNKDKTPSEEIHAIIIDPGYSPKKFTSFLHENNLVLDAIILTHHHNDHTGAIHGILCDFDAKVMIHTSDADMFGKHVDRYLNNGDVLFLNGEKLEIIHTPGHTKGGIAVLAKESKKLFSGDTLFLKELGRTDLEDGDEQELMNTVKNIIEKWDNELWIYPGHEEGGTLGSIKKNNLEYKMLLEGRDRYIYFN